MFGISAYHYDDNYCCEYCYNNIMSRNSLQSGISEPREKRKELPRLAALLRGLELLDHLQHLPLPLPLALPLPLLQLLPLPLPLLLLLLQILLVFLMMMLLLLLP